MNNQYKDTFPENWNTNYVKNLYEIGRGRVISKEELSDTGLYPVYSSQTKNEGIMGRINTYDFNDELITWTTDGANAGTIFLRNGKFNCTNVCGTLKLTSFDVSNKFMYYSLTYCSMFHRRPDTNGAKIMNNEMANILVAYPNIEEQNKVANFLDEKVAKINEDVINCNSELIKLETYFSNYITSHFDNDSINTIKLKYLTNIKTSNVDKKIYDGESIYDICNYVDVYYNKYIDSNKALLKASVSPSQYESFKLEAGDLVITKDSEDNRDIGIPAIYRGGNKEAICGYHLSILKNSKRINSEYLYYYFLSKTTKSVMEIKTNGITRYGMKLSTIGDLEFPDILIEDQEKISSNIKVIDEKIKCIKDNLVKKIQLLEEYKKVLINDAVTGKIKIGDEYAK